MYIQENFEIFEMAYKNFKKYNNKLDNQKYYDNMI